MDSSATLSRHHRVRKQCDTALLAGKHPPPCRTPSFSSSSSSLDQSMYSHDDSLLSPATPLRLISRVPFSWEHFPGIPKNHTQNCKISKKLESFSLKLLPLPPPTATNHSSNSDHQKGHFQRDPFFAALVECSKSKDDLDHDREEEVKSSSFSNNNLAKVSRSLSDRFGFISLHASCKKACSVSESLVHLPSSQKNKLKKHEQKVEQNRID